LIVGDFNISDAQWLSDQTAVCGASRLIQVFAVNYSLTQIAREPTRNSALLNLILVSSDFINLTVSGLSPVGDSDYNAQIMSLPLREEIIGRIGESTSVDYVILSTHLQSFGWLAAFMACVTANDYAARFISELLSAIVVSTCHKPACRRKRLLRHIVNLLRNKRKSWL
jgi:hypothetical protein